VLQVPLASVVQAEQAEIVSLSALQQSVVLADQADLLLVQALGVAGVLFSLLHRVEWVVLEGRSQITAAAAAAERGAMAVTGALAEPSLPQALAEQVVVEAAAVAVLIAFQLPVVVAAG
jgi:hypothetical protein